MDHEENQGAAAGEPVHNPDLMAIAEDIERQQLRDGMVDQQLAQADQLQQSQPLIDASAAMIGAAVKGAVKLAAQKFRDLEKIWTDTVVDNTARAAAAVMIKYDVSTPEFVGKYAEEINLMMTIAPPMFASWLLMKAQLEAELAARKRAERENAPGAPPLAQSAA